VQYLYSRDTRILDTSEGWKIGCVAAGIDTKVYMGPDANPGVAMTSPWSTMSFTEAQAPSC